MPPVLTISLAVGGGWILAGFLLGLAIGRGVRIADRRTPPEPARLHLVTDSRWSAVETDTPSTTGSIPGGTP